MPINFFSCIIRKEAAKSDLFYGATPAFTPLCFSRASFQPFLPSPLFRLIKLNLNESLWLLAVTKCRVRTVTIILGELSLNH